MRWYHILALQLVVVLGVEFPSVPAGAESLPEHMRSGCTNTLNGDQTVVLYHVLPDESFVLTDVIISPSVWYTTPIYVTAEVLQDQTRRLFAQTALSFRHDPPIADGMQIAPLEVHLVTGLVFASGSDCKCQVNVTGSLQWVATWSGYVVPRSPSASQDGPVLNGSQLFPLNRPNPFSIETKISYTTQTSGPVAIRVYDPSGRQVRTITGGNLAPGEHTALWDGCDDAGRALSGGSYFYEVEAGGRCYPGKAVLVR